MTLPPQNHFALDRQPRQLVSIVLLWLLPRHYNPLPLPKERKDQGKLCRCASCFNKLWYPHPHNPGAWQFPFLPPPSSTEERRERVCSDLTLPPLSPICKEGKRFGGIIPVVDHFSRGKNSIVVSPPLATQGNKI